MKHGKTFAGNTRHGGNWSYKEYEIFPLCRIFSMGERDPRKN